MELTLEITAPVTVIVAPYKKIPNIPPGYIEARRHARERVTVIECWPVGVTPPHTATLPIV